MREFLIGIYEKALEAYDLDGFKLDFIDRFKLKGNSEVKPGMDYTCIQEATERLMTDIMRRLKARKEDIMIEFRQSYIGPGMRRYGNMFRVADCASDITSNRIGIADLRLLSGQTAVHSDMLTWNAAETLEDAALQILNSIFGVIQFSMRIDRMTPEHRKMTAFWLKFAAENRKLLLESGYHYHAATCGHDYRTDAAVHQDSDNDGKCDVCGAHHGIAGILAGVLVVALAGVGIVVYSAHRKKD